MFGRYRLVGPTLASLALAVLLAAGIVLTLPFGLTAEAQSVPVRVVVPEGRNLQFMSFWIAQGAGFFAEEGLDVQVVVPPAPPAATQMLLRGRADVAILPPPMYLELIGQEQPILVFANLLQNDQINLVVRKDVLEARKLSPTAPLVERLRGMQGLKVGVAPGPPTRLRALFASVGMDVDRDIQMVILHGDQQNRAFAEHQVDALYAHTPFLETALVEQGAVMLVNQSRGEVPELASRQIHSLVTTRSFASARPDVLVAMARAVYRAQQLIHADRAAATDALFRSGVPGLERRLVEAIAAIYEPAIPQTPEVSIGGVERAHELFPASRTPPDLSKIDLASYVAPQFAQQAISEGLEPARAAPPTVVVEPLLIALALSMLGAIAILAGWRARKIRHAQRR